MSNTIFFFLGIFFICVVVIHGLIQFNRRQQLVIEKKLQLDSFKKKLDYHFTRYKAYVREIERIKSKCYEKTEEMIEINKDIDEKKKSIKEALELVIKEQNQLEGFSDPSVEKILERRKLIVQKQWDVLDKKKMVYLEKRKEALSINKPIEVMNIKKDKEYALFSKMGSEVERKTKEYESVREKPLFFFKMKKN